MASQPSRKHLNRLMEWARNYQTCRVLTTAVEKQILERFADAPHTVDEVVESDEDEQGLRRFVRTLVALDLLDTDEGLAFEPSPITEDFLLPDSPFDLRPVCSLFHRNYEMWQDLPEVVEKGQDVETNVFGDVEFGPEFMLAMETRAHFSKQDVAEAVGPRLNDGDRILDLGGGTGVFTREILKKTAGTTAVLADLEHVVDTAREFAGDLAESGRLEFRELDFFEDESYGESFDVALLFSVCHMFDPDALRTVLSRTAGALRSRGTLVIRDYVLNESGLGPLEANLFDLHMMLATDGGRNYSLPEFRELLEDTGFTGVRVKELPGDHDDLVLAERP